ncbi:MAG: hypothetical protein HKN26_01705 [Acidimicrobiales bacterium]|nr:hypothetical protein [Acidimicrobiales bacterium]
MPGSLQRDDDGRFIVQYTEMRYLVLKLLLDAGGHGSVAELARRLDALPVCKGRRSSSQIVSNSMRHPVKLGWVVRRGRGKYELVRLSRGTEHRIRTRVAPIFER